MMDELERARIYGQRGAQATQSHGRNAAWWAFAVFLYVCVAAFVASLVATFFGWW